MTSSRDSLIPDVPDKSEMERRIELALAHARSALERSELYTSVTDAYGAAASARNGLHQVIAALDMRGKS